MHIDNNKKKTCWWKNVLRTSFLLLCTQHALTARKACCGCVVESLSILHSVELIKSRGATSEIWGAALRSPSQLTIFKHNGQHLAAAGGIQGFQRSYDLPVFFALCKHFQMGVLFSSISNRSIVHVCLFLFVVNFYSLRQATFFKWRCCSCWH